MFVKIGDAWFNPDEITAISLPSDMKDPTKIIVTLRQGVSVRPDATMDEAEAALIDAGVIENPYPDEGDEPELTEEERAELQVLYDAGYKVLARDADGKLYAYMGSPTLEGGYYYAPGATKPAAVTGAFAFIGPADKAVLISYLLCT